MFLLFLFLIPVIVLAVFFCICAALFLVPFILLTLPVAIPMWIVAALYGLSREPAL